MVEAVDGLGGDELEHNGIRCVVPAEHPAKDDQDEAVESEDDAPDGLAGMVGNPQGDKVGAAGGCARLERDGDGEAGDHAAKDDEHDLIAQKRSEMEDIEEERGQRDLRHGEDDKALADAAPAHKGDRDVEREHAERGVDANAAQRGDAVDKDRHAGKAAGQQICGLNERLDKERLDKGGREDGDRGDDTADNGEACQLKCAVGKVVDNVRHVCSFAVMGVMVGVCRAIVSCACCTYRRSCQAVRREHCSMGVALMEVYQPHMVICISISGDVRFSTACMHAKLEM